MLGRYTTGPRGNDLWTMVGGETRSGKFKRLATGRLTDGARSDSLRSQRLSANEENSMNEREATDRGLTAQLVQLCRGIGFRDLSPDAVTVARQCLLDWLGVTLAGSSQPLAVILRGEVLAEGGNARATLIGTGDRVSLQQAALVNGAASHALDYDDVHLAMSGHPTVPIMPALLALAEERNATLDDVIAAFVAGVEMECRIGAAVMPGHYTTGFHATGTLGTFAAAAACAHLMGLEQGQWLSAMGIAGAQAAGLKAMFGTMCKPFHAGKAAANGLLAASLAARGFDSNGSVIEAAQGFAATQTTTFNHERALAKADEFAVRDVLFKYHAACYGTHETIEGVLRLKERLGIRAADVARIQLEVPAGNLAMCNIEAPKTALEGKFSMRFTAALALARDDTSESAFTNASVFEADLAALRDRVRVDGTAAPGAGTRVTLALKDGRTVEERVNLNVPETDLARQWDRLRLKFLGLASPVVGISQAKELSNIVESGAPSISVREFVRLTAPSLVGAR